jgi:hypothetical protein
MSRFILLYNEHVHDYEDCDFSLLRRCIAGRNFVEA